MHAPTTYNEWSECLEALAGGQHDAEVVAAMANGSLNWASGWAETFSRRLFETINIRLKRCADRMDREFALGFSETIIIRAMLDTRRTLVLLHRVGNLPSFPDTLKAHVSNEIEQYAKRSQHSLEESAKQDRTGQLSRMVKHNSLLNYRQQAAQEQEIIVQSTVQSAQARPILSNLPKQNQDHERNDRHAMLGILGVIGVLIIGAVIYSYR